VHVDAEKGAKHLHQKTVPDADGAHDSYQLAVHYEAGKHMQEIAIME
jgi:hypothetical protein